LTARPSGATPNVSVIDLKFIAKKATSKDVINAAIIAAAQAGAQGILATTSAAGVDRLQSRRPTARPST
jgi:glyceraldehyde-3-phosphate dehydrogenase/erythrose-4-phosphate dehydrogenase